MYLSIKKGNKTVFLFLQTLLCDINSITTDGHRWTQEDKYTLEGQLLMHTNENLCLHPSPISFQINNHVSYRPMQVSGMLLNRYFFIYVIQLIVFSCFNYTENNKCYELLCIYFVLITTQGKGLNY